jgi:hypothetical protein
MRAYGQRELYTEMMVVIHGFENVIVAAFDWREESQTL